MTSYELKKKLISTGQKTAICESCKLTKWLKADIPLHLHHVDGDPSNNNLTNLQLLCPNCHAQTPNYAGRNKKKSNISVVTDDQLIECVNASRTKHEALLRAGLNGKGANYKRIRNLIATGKCKLIVPDKSTATLKRLETLIHRYGTTTPSYRTKITWPDINTLTSLLKDNPVVKVAKQLGVSDNAVRKKAKSFNINLREISKWSHKHNPKWP